jgi:hypothetical protein
VPQRPPWLEDDKPRASRPPPFQGVFLSLSARRRDDFRRAWGFLRLAARNATPSRRTTAARPPKKTMAWLCGRKRRLPSNVLVGEIDEPPFRLEGVLSELRLRGTERGAVERLLEGCVYVAGMAFYSSAMQRP